MQHYSGPAALTLGLYVVGICPSVCPPKAQSLPLKFTERRQVPLAALVLTLENYMTVTGRIDVANGALPQTPTRKLYGRYWAAN